MRNLVYFLKTDDKDYISDTKSYKHNENNTVKYNYSLKAKLYETSEGNKILYRKIKNLLLSYHDMKVFESWNYDRFSMNGKTLFKLTLRMNKVCIYFSKNPKMHLNEIYRVFVVSNIKEHQNTPYLLNIDDHTVEHNVVMIIKSMLKIHKQDKNYELKDLYDQKFDMETLIKMNLIKKMKTK